MTVPKCRDDGWGAGRMGDAETETVSDGEGTAPMVGAWRARLTSAPDLTDGR